MWGPTEEDFKVFKWVAIIVTATLLAIAFALGAWMS